MLLALEWSGDHSNRLQFDKAFGYLLIAAFLQSIADLSIKVALADLSFWDVFGFSRAALLLPAAIVFSRPLSRRLIVDSFRERGFKLLTAVGLIEAGAMVSLLLVVMALSRGPLALVSTTQSTIPMFVLGYTLILNRVKSDFVPLKDKDRSAFFQVLLCLGIVAGVYMLHLE